MSPLLGALVALAVGREVMLEVRGDAATDAYLRAQMADAGWRVTPSARVAVLVAVGDGDRAALSIVEDGVVVLARDVEAGRADGGGDGAELVRARLWLVIKSGVERLDVVAPSDAAAVGDWLALTVAPALDVDARVPAVGIDIGVLARGPEPVVLVWRADAGYRLWSPARALAVHAVPLAAAVYLTTSGSMRVGVGARVGASMRIAHAGDAKDGAISLGVTAGVGPAVRGELALDAFDLGALTIFAEGALEARAVRQEYLLARERVQEAPIAAPVRVGVALSW